jgi:hypothetical protein
MSCRAPNPAEQAKRATAGDRVRSTRGSEGSGSPDMGIGENEQSRAPGHREHKGVGYALNERNRRSQYERARGSGDEYR